MIITKEVLQGLETNINVTWQKRFKAAKWADLWKQIAMQVNSKNASEKYAWLGAVPGLREFKDERRPGSLTGYSYEISNKKFESTLDVDRDHIEDDRTGEIMLAVTGLATKAAQHYTRLICDVFKLGFTTAIFDGQNFFSASHSTGSNYLGTDDLDGAGVDAAELLLAGQVDDKGEPLGYRGTHIIVGPALRAAANALVNVPTLTGGAANPHYKRYEVVELPYMAVTDKQWALADLSQGLMPFILQIRTAITLVSKTDLNSDRAFDKDVFTWGTRARHNAGFGNHQLIVGAVNS
jgi:phage major head subunit gpT-like protein